MTAVQTQKSPWLFGAVPDLLFGCGGLYAGIALLFAIDGGVLLRAVPPLVPGLLIAFLSAPHYGATLLRVYERRADRRAYFLFSVVVTCGLIALFGLALFDAFVGSILVTVYLTWSGWHYSGQNYGIASMFLRRRGLAPSAGVRRLLYASFGFSFLVVFLVLHEAVSVGGGASEGFVALGIPASWNAWLVPGSLALYALTTGASLGLLARAAGGVATLGPTAALMGTQALWLMLPYAAYHFGWFQRVAPLGFDTRAAVFTWIAAAHAVQYLWITSFYERASGRWRGQGAYYARALGAGTALWVLPAVVFAPGIASYDLGFTLLLSSTINLHHFVLDGAIWKLRHLKIARVLIADGGGEEGTSWVPRRFARVFWAFAGLALVLKLHNLSERYVVFPQALRARDLPAAAASLDRQGWLGKATAFQHQVVAERMDDAGQLEGAIGQYERSAELTAQVENLAPLAMAYGRAADAAGFMRSCDRLFALGEVERPLPTPPIAHAWAALPADFRAACVRTAHREYAKAKRPAPSRNDPAMGRDGEPLPIGSYD
jgi:hypothetical protein